MATDRGRRRRWRGWAAVAAGLAPWLGPPAPLSGQAPLYRVDEATTVSSVAFDVTGGDVLLALRLREALALRAPGPLSGVQSFFAWMPFVGSPVPPPFDPVTLQQDVVRLRELYRESGFPGARVDYRVDVDTVANRVAVTFEIEAGPPRTLGGVRVEGPAPADTGALQMGALRARLALSRGQRLGASERDGIEADVRAWAAGRGYPYPRVQSRVDAAGDSLAPLLVLRLDPGPRARIGRIRVEGVQRLDTATVLGQMVIRPGDRYAGPLVDESSRRLLDLELVRFALVEARPGEGDSLVDLRVRLSEGLPRLVSGRAGYADGTGVLAEASWAHRDLLGDGRTFRVDLSAETGLWSLEDFPVRRYGVTASLKEPGFAGPRYSLLLRALAGVEDGPRELARSVGGDATVVRGFGDQRFLSLSYGVDVKDVVEFRGGGLGPLGLIEVLRLVEEAEEATRFQGSLTLSASWGARDEPARPGLAWTLRGAAELGGVDPWSASEYVRMDASASILRLLWAGGPRLLVRARAGRLVPFGRSLDEGTPLDAYLRLDDQLFTEGGTRGLRGWERDLVGPKIPQIEFEILDDSLALTARDRYVPLGGFARWAGSLELQWPLPLVRGEHHALLFVDAGRVWTPDDRFLGDDGLSLLGFFDDTVYGVGGGLALDTAVGPVRLMVGYKLRPSPLDLKDPLGVGRALLDGASDLDVVPSRASHRWRIHIGIGEIF